ncbi:PepSY domain-containing protein [Lentzea sp. NPDC004789]
MGSGSRTAVAVLAAALIAVPQAQAAEQTSIGRVFDDGLDTRLAAASLADGARSAGYTSAGHLGGRTADEAWTDGRNANVFGLFGHANAGIFQTSEGPTDNEDPILAAGKDSDLTSPYVALRFFSEYLPAVDVDDMKILVLAGCYTANSSAQFGGFNDVPVRRGVDSVITFPDLVYFPASSASTPISATNYSGNYFWSRFAAHTASGASVANALAWARTDLIAKEGSAGGWDRYVIRGSVADPGAVTLTPAAPGEPLTSRPTQNYQSFDTLTVTRTSSSGDGLTIVDTAEQVRLRRTANGRVLDAVGTPATSGPVLLDEAAAVRRAREFAGAGSSPAESGPISHVADDAVTHVVFRQSHPGGTRQVIVEVDRRSGAVVYYADLAAAGSGDAVISRDEAISKARKAIGVTDGTATATADVWDVARWTVTIDRGLQGRSSAPVPDVRRVVVDARSGAIIHIART